MTGVFIALMALMSFGFGLILRSTAGAIAAFVGVVFVLPLVMRGHLRTRPSLRADQHPHQLDHVHRQPRAGRDTPTALAGRRVVADGRLCRNRPRRRRRAVRQARRLSEAGAEGGWVQIRIPEERAEQAKRLARLIGREPFQKRSWAELGFFLASSALACVGVLALAALGFAGLVAHGRARRRLDPGRRLAGRRGLGRWQRALARRMLGEEIAEPEPFTARPGLFGWLRASLGDRAAWRAVATSWPRCRSPSSACGSPSASGSRRCSASLRLWSVVARRPGSALFSRLLGPGYNSGSAPGFATHVGCVRDRGRVALCRPVDDEAGRLPGQEDDAPPARPRRRRRPG